MCSHLGSVAYRLFKTWVKINNSNKSAKWYAKKDFEVIGEGGGGRIMNSVIEINCNTRGKLTLKGGIETIKISLYKHDP